MQLLSSLAESATVDTASVWERRAEAARGSFGVGRHPSRTDAKCGDHSLQADFSLPMRMSRSGLLPVCRLSVPYSFHLAQTAACRKISSITSSVCLQAIGRTPSSRVQSFPRIVEFPRQLRCCISICYGHSPEDRPRSRSQATGNEGGRSKRQVSAAGASVSHRNWPLRKAYVRSWASAAASAL
jgi:hypothetical protein